MPSSTASRVAKAQTSQARIWRARSKRKRLSDTPQMHPLLHLQQSIGNRAVGRLIQAKVRISQPGDVYEQEADRVAEQIVSIPESVASPSLPIAGNAHGLSVHRMPEMEDDKRVLQRPPEAFESPRKEEEAVIQRMPQEEAAEEQTIRRAVIAEEEDEVVRRMPMEGEEEEEAISGLQKKLNANAAHSVNPVVTSSINAMRGGGEPLPPLVRAHFEPRFGADFGQVRVHKDARAAESAEAMNARAYTTGKEIVFGGGEYAPETAEGRKLLAHELTYVVQQSGADVVRAGQSTGNRGLYSQKRIIWSGPIHHGTLTIQRATRQELLTAYSEALSRSAWNEVAVRLNGFNDADIKDLVRNYSKATLIAVKDAALTVMPGWNARVVRPVNARLAALMGSSEVLHASAKEIQDYLLHSPFLKAYVSSKFSGGNPLEGHIHIDDDATFRTACVASIMRKEGKTREEAEAIEPQQAAFREGDEIHVRKDEGNFTTTIHESMHRFSSPEYQRRLSKNANEGATEYFTRIICRDQGLTRAGSYESAFRSTALLVGATSKATVADAYFNGALSALLTAVDTAKGAGTLRRWSAFMNTGSYAQADALLK